MERITKEPGLIALNPCLWSSIGNGGRWKVSLNGLESDDEWRFLLTKKRGGTKPKALFVHPGVSVLVNATRSMAIAWGASDTNLLL